MKILGIKSSHDGALALIDDGRLIFSLEMEKLNNNQRLQEFNLTLEEIEFILNEYNYDLGAIDEIVIDGWRNDKEDVMNSEREEEITLIRDLKISEGRQIDLRLSKYGVLLSEGEDILQTQYTSIDSLDLSYSSYMHVSGHIFCAYCTSPFARYSEDCYILVWDGGMPPQLFYYYGNTNKVANCGVLFLMFGGVYPEFAYEFSPFDEIKDGHSVPGKLMAYIALGRVNDLLLGHFFRIYQELESRFLPDTNIRNINRVTRQFISLSKELCDTMDIPNENILCTFHIFLENLLLDKLASKIHQLPYLKDNFCFVGGCALSIKWNSKLRDSGLFGRMWVPPFPNDSGSAIGAACCAMVHKSDHNSLEWNVYSGPGIIKAGVLSDTYRSKPFSVKRLACLLYEKNEPVVVLNDRAELGPRALGNRSIISSATSPKMKKLLNKIKGREFYRPVAPICLEADAPGVFFPGNPDPFMLFEHTVKEEWKGKVPAIVHLDGSARLQTVNKGENACIYELLTAYKELSGIPLLCNTSANFKGKGFFPDVHSVMEWDSVNYIWCNDILYERQEKLDLFESI